MRAQACVRRAQGSTGASTVRGGSLLSTRDDTPGMGGCSGRRCEPARGAAVLLAAALIALCAATAAAGPQFVKVTTTPLDFGKVYTGATFTGLGTVTVTAPPGTCFKVTWGAGFHYFAGSRHMQRSGGADTLPYSLYRDAGCSVALGDAGLGDTFPAGSSIAGTGIGRDQLITIYGRLSVPAQARPGFYTDSVVVTVEY